MKSLQPFLHFHRIGRAAAEEALDRALEHQDRARWIPGGRFPELAARYVGARAFIRWQQPAVRLLRRQILDDGVRFPQPEIAVLEARHALVRIEGRVRGGFLVAL